MANEILVDRYENKQYLNKIMVTPATIRKCNGFVVETTTLVTDRKLLLQVLSYLNENEFSVYSLIHKENDWSYPSWIVRSGGFVNRYGWFVTKDTMKFRKDQKDAVLLYKKNTEYYQIGDKSFKILDSSEHAFNVKETNLQTYLLKEDLIWGSKDNFKRNNEILRELINKINEEK